MSEGKERIVVEHPMPWVLRMVEGRVMRVTDKTLYLVESALGAVFQVLPERG